jgi:hypothetical protein
VPPSPLAITRSQIIWISGAVAAFIVAIIVVAFLHGPQATNCDGLVVKATVLDLVKKHSRLPDTTDYHLDSIRQTGGDIAAGSITCAADISGSFNNAPYATAHLTYTVTREADGEVMVTVKGISDLSFP